MDKEILKVALDDIRSRHKSEVDILLFMHNISAQILRLYITLGVVTATAAVATLNKEGIYASIFWSLLSASLMFICGVHLCFKAMRGGEINLPGRDPDFWDWIITEKINEQDILKVILQEYISGLEEAFKLNKGFNKRAANSLKKAKDIGIYVIPISFFAGLIRWLITHWEQELRDLFHYFHSWVVVWLC